MGHGFVWLVFISYSSFLLGDINNLISSLLAKTCYEFLPVMNMPCIKVNPISCG